MEHDTRLAAVERKVASGDDGDRLRIGLSNLPDEETALRVARSLVQEGLAACVNVLPPCRSVYRWQGKVEETTEWPLLVKTTSARWIALVERLRALHPYEVPEIVELSVGEVDAAYGRWAADTTRTV